MCNLQGGFVFRNKFSETTSEFYQTSMAPKAPISDEVPLVVGIRGREINQPFLRDPRPDKEHSLTCPKAGHGILRVIRGACHFGG
jgi:hypothetical protein